MRIQVLDQATSNRIAAGEVVERPASVIKELCENALDAQATAITVEFENGGLTYMRVADNGTGIDPEDLPVAFLRHATGKIRSGDSLMGIETLGFRGEALAAIAAVSRVEATSRVRGAQAGHRIVLHGGEVVQSNAAGSPEGTSIVVSDLFFNTPARLKFTKSPSSEAARIGDTMLRIMLSNPDVSFRLLNNRKLVMQTPGTGLYDAICAVYGSKIAESCVPLIEEEGETKFFGYVGLPEISRQSRVAQTLIVNGRCIKNDALSDAVAAGFGDKLMVGRHPFFVVNISMPFAAVDVNVHPQKAQVRFVNEKDLAEKLKHVVSSSFVQDMLAPVLELTNEDKEPIAKEEPVDNQAVSYILNTTTLDERINELEAQIPIYASTPDYGFQETPGMELINTVRTFQDTGFNAYDQFAQLSFEEHESEDFGARPQLLGQLFSTYALVQLGDSLLIIDQHAAHERITYDRYKQQIEEGKIASQALLTPELIDLSYPEMQSFLLLRGQFEQLGFDVEPFGKTTVAVRGVPVLLYNLSAIELFLEVLDQAEKTPLKTFDLQRERIIRSACRHSVKAGDKLTNEEIKVLAQELKKNERLTCPHGRPIALRITKTDLEKGFYRIV